MVSKKDILAKTLYQLRLNSILRYFNQIACNNLSILAYHRILDLPENEEFNFDPGLISASTSEFRWQVEHIRKFYNPIGFKTLIDSLNGRMKLPKKAVMITFDDGYDDNYYHAFPILHQAQVPATVFLSTGYIDQHETFWYDWIYYIFNQAKVEEIAFSQHDLHYTLDEDATLRRSYAYHFIEYIKRIENSERLALIVELEKITQMSQPKNGFRWSHPLSWKQVSEMSAGNIEFGSHAVTHPILSQLTDVELLNELELSMREIKFRSKSNVDVVAYPVGMKFAYNDKVIRTAKQVGYRVGVSYLSGINDLRKLDLFSLKRIHIERYINKERFSAMLSLPQVFSK